MRVWKKGGGAGQVLPHLKFAAWPLPALAAKGLRRIQQSLADSQPGRPLEVRPDQTQLLVCDNCFTTKPQAQCGSSSCLQ